MAKREHPNIDLSPGLYELLVTEGLKGLIDNIDETQFAVKLSRVDSGDSHLTIARKLFSILQNIMRIPPAKQISLYNKIIDLLKQETQEAEDHFAIHLPLQQLLAIAKRDPAGEAVIPLRPSAALSSNALLTNAREEPSIGAELRRKLDSADRADLICAFIRWYGLRILIGPLQSFINRGGQLRVITTTYMAATEVRALDKLAETGASVKVAYESQTTRLHAKAWLFHRDSGFSSAYMGSSNISKSALLDGLEWNVRVSEIESPQLLEKFRATFESYWECSLFESYDPQRDHDKIHRALSSEHKDIDIQFHHSAAATYVSHRGSRPISFTWRLKHEMPQEIFEQAKVVAG